MPSLHDCDQGIRMVGDGSGGSGGSGGRIEVAVGTGDGVRVGTGVRAGVAGAAAVGTGVAAAFGPGVGTSVGTGVAACGDAGVSVEAGGTTGCVAPGVAGSVAGVRVCGAADSTAAESDTALGAALRAGTIGPAVGEAFGALTWAVVGDASPLNANRAR